MDIVTSFILILGIINIIIIVYVKNSLSRLIEVKNDKNLLLRNTLRNISKICAELITDVDSIDKEISLIKKDQSIAKPLGKGSHWAVKRALKATNDNSGKEVKAAVKSKRKSKKQTRPTQKPFQ